MKICHFGLFANLLMWKPSWSPWTSQVTNSLQRSEVHHSHIYLKVTTHKYGQRFYWPCKNGTEITCEMNEWIVNCSKESFVLFVCVCALLSTKPSAVGSWGLTVRGLQQKWAPGQPGCHHLWPAAPSASAPRPGSPCPWAAASGTASGPEQSKRASPLSYLHHRRW